MIIVTGANGKMGRGVVEQLLRRVPAKQIGVSVRDTQQTEELENLGVRVRQGDFKDAKSLLHAFEGASQVLIVSTNVLGEEAVRQHSNAIHMAKEAGASRILYTSHMSASPASHAPFSVDHAATEEALKDSNVAFTSLRNGYYAASLPWFLSGALKTGELIAPEDGPVAWTSHADLAEATAVILTEHTLGGITPNLTAAEAVDLQGVADIVSELLGRSIRRVVVSDEEFRARLIAQGMAEHMADMFLTFFYASRAGEFSHTDPTLERLIGRSPISVRDYLIAHPLE